VRESEAWDRVFVAAGREIQPPVNFSPVLESVTSHHVVGRNARGLVSPGDIAAGRDLLLDDLRELRACRRRGAARVAARD
jgi:hypothetical protein